LESKKDGFVKNTIEFRVKRYKEEFNTIEFRVKRYKEEFGFVF